MSLISFENTQIDLYPVELQAAFKAFAMKNKHKLVVIKYGEDSKVLRFLDPRSRDVGAHAEVGAVWFDRNAGRGSEGAYVIHSPKIQNNKYRKGATEHKQLVTNDVRKVVKYMLEYLHPMTSVDIAKQSAKVRNDYIDVWRNELYREVFTNNFARDNDAMKELERLNSLGVQFNYTKFIDAVNLIPKWKEYNRRMNTKVSSAYVMLHGDKASLVVGYKDKTGEAQSVEKDYDSHDKLPEHVYQKLSLLKMLEDGKGIPEVGVRVNANQYWVFLEPAAA